MSFRALFIAVIGRAKGTRNNANTVAVWSRVLEQRTLLFVAPGVVRGKHRLSRDLIAVQITAPFQDRSDSFYDRGITFRRIFFLNGGSESSETDLFLCMILVVYLDHGIFYPVAVLVFSHKTGFRVKKDMPQPPKVRGSIKKEGGALLS